MNQNLVIIVLFLLMTAPLAVLEPPVKEADAISPFIPSEEAPSERVTVSPELGEHFIENLGQAGGPDGAFYLQGSGTSVIFRTDRITVVFGDGDRGSTYDVTFVGARPVTPEGVDPTGTTYNYFLGNDPSRWVTGARGFSGIRYEGLWDGIDLVYLIADGELKYDLLVAPGASPERIRLRYEGVDGLCLDPVSGALLVRTLAGTCRDDRPLSFQDGPAGPVSVESEFVLLGPSTVGFAVGEYDATQRLVIDPKLMFSTFLGSAGDDHAMACDVGPGGDLYIMGVTDGDRFPTVGAAYGSRSGGKDVFVSRLSDDGERLLYSTYIGGSSDDNGPGSKMGNQYSAVGGICVDDGGNVYVTGHTISRDFPTTPGAFREDSYDDDLFLGDIFLLKLSPSGDRLEFSTFIGTRGVDGATDVCVDLDGNPIICGYSQSPYPVTGDAYKGSPIGVVAAVVTRFSPDGDVILNSTKIGGLEVDVAWAVAVGPDGCVYLAGYAERAFPTTPGAFDTTYGGNDDMFVVKFDPNLTRLEYSTLVGTSTEEYATDIAIDDQGRAYVTGFTKSPAFPVVQDCFRTTSYGRRDSVLFRLSPDGSDLEASTYYGSIVNDECHALALAPNGSAWIAGHSYYQDVPTTPDAYDRTNNEGWDSFVARFDANLTTLEYGSFFGSTIDERSWDMDLDPTDGTVYVVGGTNSTDFPTTQWAFDGSYNGNADAFAFKLGVTLPPRWLELDTLEAVEDVPFDHDFSSSVVDIDTRPERLSLSSESPFVVWTDGLEARFLFREGVTSASVDFRVSDGFTTADATVNFTIEPVNDPPRIHTTALPYAVEDMEYSFNISATDPDANDTWSWTIATAAGWLRIDPSTGTLYGTPGDDDVGVFSVWVSLTDSGGLQANRSYVLTVENVVDPPEILTEDVTTALEDQPFAVDYDATDPDGGGGVNWSLTTNADWLVIEPDSGMLEGIPDNDDVGVYWVNVTVTDPLGMWTSHNFTLTVENTNDRPLIDSIEPPSSAQVGVEYSYQVMASDMDVGDTLTYSLEANPLGMEIDAITGLVLWIPQAAQVGVEAVVVRVSDGEMSIRQQFNITVDPEAVNTDPTITSDPSRTKLAPGEVFIYQVLASDPDSSDNLAFMLVTSPQLMTVDGDSGLVQWTPSADDVGEHPVTVRVIDPRGGIDEQTFTLVVEETDAKGGEGRPWWLVPLLLVLVVMGVLLAVFVYSRTKGAPPDSEA